MTTRISSPFGAKSTADEVSEGIDLTGKRAIVTGAASGIGVETVRTLARRGAEVTLAVRNADAGKAVRNADAGKKVAEEVAADTGNPDVHVRPLELTDFGSVAAFAEAWTGPLHLLVNNAGVMAIQDRTMVAKGWRRSSSRTTSDTSR